MSIYVHVMRSGLSLGLLLWIAPLACSMITNCAPKKSFREILQSPYVKEIFELLSPKKLLLENDRDNITDDGCVRDIIYFTDALEKQDRWALTMLDASSRIPPGILDGNIIDMGVFDQCLEVQGSYLGNSIHGRHCMYSINLIEEDNEVMPIKPTMSICLPSTCTARTVIDLVIGAIKKSERMTNLDISVAHAHCTENKLKLSDKEFIIWLLVMASYTGFLVLCTLLHMISDRVCPNSSWLNIVQNLSELSLIKSSQSILNLTTQIDTLGAINGLRFISITLIVLFHTYAMQFFAVNINHIVVITEWFESWRAVTLIVMSNSVDTFFILSGFLMTYGFMKKMQRNENFNIPMHYLHRFIRLTPPIIVLVYSTIAVVPRIASGPRWEWLMKLFITKLRDNWLYSLLYIQNFVNKYDYRIMHTWYLAVDMQLFLISPIILITLYKKPKMGLALLAFLIVICQVVAASITGINSYPVLYLTREWNLTLMQESYNELYQVPYTRASPWLFGIILGFMVSKNLRPNRWIKIIGWSTASAGFVTLLICIRNVALSPEPNFIRDVMFMLFAKVIWSIVICWIIYCSITDRTGIVSRILSWKYFLPLSRLSYSVYLIHMIFPTLRIGASRVPAYFNDYQI
ncbi:hypothetical protein QAD02_023627, partial [Eretmocerus hayati]